MKTSSLAEIGEAHKGGFFGTKIQDVLDDTVVSLTLPCQSGTYILNTGTTRYPYPEGQALLFIDSGSSSSIGVTNIGSAAGKIEGVNDTPLDGTTGDDGKITVNVNDDSRILQIENRIGVTTHFTLTSLALMY